MSVVLVCGTCSNQIDASDCVELSDEGTLIHQVCHAKACEVLKEASSQLCCRVCERAITKEDTMAYDSEGRIIHTMCTVQILATQPVMPNTTCIARIINK